jgi:FG-GAP-like repeat/FG-GAP repeat
MGKHLVMRQSLGRFLALRGVQIIALLCAAMVDVVTVNAATITVTTTADSGAGSLRDALAAASDGDTIQFDAALNGQSIMLTSAELTIDKHITISGPGAPQLAVTRSSGTFRIFHVLPGHVVTIEGLTISNGKGILGGGVLNDHATLTLNNCAVQNNQARYGGGVYNDSLNGSATLNIFSTIVSGNLADGSGSSAFGGGICTIGAGANLTITNSTVSGNVSNSADSIACSGFGGGIHNSGDPASMQFLDGGTVTITNSVVRNNSAGQGSGPPSPFPCGYGGGISNYGPMSITNSTISGNTAGLHGGGIDHSHGTLTMSNSTVSANSATGINGGQPEGWGGGIANGYMMTITNSTISGNSSTFSGGGVGHGIFTKITHSTISGNTANQGGGIASSPGESCSTCHLEIQNTILQSGATGANIFMFNNTGTATSLGYNLSSDDGSGVLTAAGDRINTDPMLGPLQNNGGPTFTHDLLAGSPAIDAGDPNFTPPPLYDQRGPGYDRVVNGRIDVGSLEVQPAPTLGNYPNISVPLSGDTAVTPDATPANTTSINVSTDSNFHGTFAASPTAGVVTVTDAHPAGTYAVMVTAFGPGGTTTKTFALTVTRGISCGAGFTFTGNIAAGGANPQSVAIGDFNGDGQQDLAIANGQFSPPFTVSIRLGNGLGGFAAAAEVSVVSSPYSVAIGDFNGDGKQDLAVANNSPTGTVSIRLGDGLGGFTGSTEVSVGSGPRSVAIGDFNGDGKQDLAVANSGANTVSIRLGDGLGGFSGSTSVDVGSGPRSVAIGDFNGDGKEDFATANDGANTVSIRLGDGLGGFSGATEISVGSSPVSVAIGDFNGDGKQDLAVANSGSQTVSIRLGDGLGGFSGSTQIGVGIFGANPSCVAIGDFNGDSKQDFAVSTTGVGSQQPGPVSIRLGDGMGGFSGSMEITGGYFLSSVAIGDFNGDSKQDLAVTNLLSGAVSIELGQCISEPSPTPTPTATPSPTPTPTPTPTATPSPTPTPAPTPTPPPAPAQALQLSTRMLVQTGDNVGIGGFIITGSSSKRVLLRAVGPTLAQFGIPNPLADPVMELHGPPGFVTIINDDCADGQIPPSLCQPASLDAGIEATLDPGAYTAIVRGKNNTTGVALVEVYDLTQGSDSKLANLSTRAFVGTAADIVIAGVLLGGNSNSYDQIVVRGLGPSLANLGVPHALADPRLELRDEHGTLLASNDNWQDNPALILPPPGLAPSNPLESAIVAQLPPGAYTALLSGVNNGTGVGLVEVYDRVGQP